MEKNKKFITKKSLILSSLLLCSIGVKLLYGSIIIKDDFEKISLNKEVMTIPNTPSWEHVETRAYSENFMSNYGVDGLIGNELENVDDLYADSAYDYFDWFLDNGDYVGVVGGGNNHSLKFRIDLYDFSNNSPTNSEKTYQVEKIKINDLHIYSDNGAVGGLAGPEIWDSYNKIDFEVTEENSEIYLQKEDVLIENDSTHESQIEESYVLEPTYNAANNEDEEWVDLLKVDDGSFYENYGSRTYDPVLSYSWEKNTSYIDFELTNSADWVFALLGGSYHFATFLSMDYDEYVVRDESNYSLENDSFGEDYKYDKTQENMDVLGANLTDDLSMISTPVYEDYSRIKPFFTSENTYGELGRIIIKNNIVDSEDKIQTSNMDFDIEFYDEYENIIPNSDHLQGSKVNFRITTEGNDENNIVVPDGKVRGETEILTYYIPYVDMSFIKNDESNDVALNHNIYNYDNVNGVLSEDDEGVDLTDNKTNFEWSYNHIDEKWELKTNVPFVMNSSFERGISSISWMDNNDPMNIGKVVLVEGQKLEDFTHKQIKNNQSNNLDYSVEIATQDSPSTFKFNYIYQAESMYDGISISPTENDEDGEVSFVEGYEKQIIEVDTNVFLDSEFITPSDRIAYGYVVDEPVKVEVSENYSQFETLSDNDGKGFVKDDLVLDSNYNIILPGTYGFAAVDEFGNNSFTVIEYVEPGVKTEMNSILFEESENNDIDKGVYQYQDNAEEEIYESLSAAEYRYMDKYIQDGNLVDIDNSIKNNKDFLDIEDVREVTNKFESGTEFNEQVVLIDNEGNENTTSIKLELEKEINHIIDSTDLGFKSNQCKIIWETSDDTIIENGMNNTDDTEITFKLVPKGNWVTKGEFEKTFTPYAYFDLEKFVYDEEAIASITNDFIIDSSVSVDDEVLNLNGEYTSITSEITKEIKNELIGYGLDEDIVNELIEVQVFESDSDSDEKSNFTVMVSESGKVGEGINSNVDLFKNRKIITFESQKRVDISKLEIQNEKLTEVTQQYFIGTQFSKMEDDLTRAIELQISEAGWNPKDFDIQFDQKDFSQLQTGVEIGYEIIPHTSEYANKIIGTFITDPFTSLDGLIMNTLPLMKITNEYTSGTKFKEMKPELTKYVYSNLESRGLDKEWVEVNWDIDDEAEVDYSTNINYSITSKTEKLQGEFEGNFNAWTFYNLNAFMLDIDAINVIIEPYLEEGYVLFSELKPLLDEEIYKELNEQGFYTNIKNDEGTEIQIIEIQWNRGEGERITLGQTLQFDITSQNDFIDNYVLKGDLENSELNFGEKQNFDSSFSIQTFLEIVILLITIGMIVIIGIMLKNKYKYKKKY